MEGEGVRIVLTDKYRADNIGSASEPGYEVEKVVLPQIASIWQTSELMEIAPHYLRRLCREVPGLAFQSSVKWYINLGRLAEYYNCKPEFMEFMKRYQACWASQRKFMGASWEMHIDNKRGKNLSSLQALAGYDFIICDDHGWPLNPDSYAGIVHRVEEKAGVCHLHPYMFRHTFVSLLLSNPDIGVATVAAEAGHAQPSAMLMIYMQQYKKGQQSIRKQLSREIFRKQRMQTRPSCIGRTRVDNKNRRKPCCLRQVGGPSRT